MWCEKDGGRYWKDRLRPLSPDLAAEFWSMSKSVIESGLPVINQEERGFDSHRKPVWVSSTQVPLHDSRGKIIGLVGIGTRYYRTQKSQCKPGRFPKSGFEHDGRCRRIKRNLSKKSILICNERSRNEEKRRQKFAS